MTNYGVLVLENIERLKKMDYGLQEGVLGGLLQGLAMITMRLVTSLSTGNGNGYRHTGREDKKWKMRVYGKFCHGGTN